MNTSKKNNSEIPKDNQSLQVIEDFDGFSKLASIAEGATKKGYERAKKSSEEIVLVEKGSVVIKKNQKSIKVISKLTERSVEVGKKQIFL